jgi:hypothetical protein
MHELPLQRGSIYHQRMIHKNLKRRIYFDTQHDSFVWCVSPKSNRIAIGIANYAKSVRMLRLNPEEK